MFFPIRDDDRALSGVAYVTWGLLIANVAVFVLGQGLGENEAFTMGYSAIPKELTDGVDLVNPSTIGGALLRHAEGPAPIYLTLISSMFMHGGYAHIGGNMLYLWIFGDNIEHRFGHVAFLAFYVLSGLAAAATQIVFDPSSEIPMLGASGAIAGVMGAYLVLFPRNKVHAIFFFRIVTIPAVLALGAWIAMQLFSGFMGGVGGGGVAYGAHIGGFGAGVAMAGVCRLFFKDNDQHIFRHSHAEDPGTKRW